MAFEVKSFKVGYEQTPDWLREFFDKGICREIYEDNDFIGISLYLPGKNKIAKKGDIILLTKSGLTLLDKKNADKFKRAKGGKANEK